MKAAILAAGSATRLRPHTEDTPKALLSVGGVPILRRAMLTLQRCGFSEFVIGTGYLEHRVREAVATWFPGSSVQFVTNPDFATTNTGASLSLMAKQLDGHAFILLDGDVVFDIAVIEKLLERGADSLAVRSVGEIGEEEVKLIADREDKVLQIGKQIPVRGAMGESLGIGLFSSATSKRIFKVLADRVGQRGLVNEYYEAAFQQCIDEGVTLYGVDIGTAYATEIDTFDDLTAANTRAAQQPPFDVTAPAIP